MRTLYLTFFLLLVTILGAQTPLELSHSLYFPSDGSEPDRRGRADLDEWVADLSAYADFTIRVEAFTDERGTVEYNEALARRRARATVSALADRGIAATGLRVLTHGERRARQSTRNDEERKTDRRVDLVATVTPHVALSVLDGNWRSRQRQTRQADPAKLMSIEGEKGGLFFIEANSLTYPDGSPVSGEVTVTLRESYDLSDMVLSGLATRAGDRLLESGGMVELRAFDGAGRELVLGQDKMVSAAIPSPDFREGMRLFSGDAPGADGTPGNWVEAPGAVARRLVDLPVPTTSPRPPADPAVYEELILPILVNRWEGENPRRDIPGGFGSPAPRRPTPPDTNRVYYPTPTGLKGVFANKEEFAARNDKRRLQELARYAVRVERWERRMEEYEANRSRHELAVIRGEEQNERRKIQRDSFIAATKIGIGKRYEAEIAAIEAEIAAWRRERMELFAAYRKERLALSLSSGTAREQSAAATSYFLSISELGWINCDRYLADPDPVEVLALLDDAPAEATVMLIPEGQRSVIRLYPATGERRWQVSGLPRGTAYRLVAYYVKDGQLRLGHQRVAAAGELPVSVSSEPVSVEALPARLATLLGS